MSSLSSILGLRAAGSLAGAPVPTRAPYYAMFHFVFAYAFLSTRFYKNFLKIDHNVSPREDVVKYGEKAVQDGKITRQQLERLKRNEGAHANAMENYPLFIGAVLFALHAGVPNETVNWWSLVYTVARILYAGAYLYIDSVGLSYLRSLIWWTGNVSCLTLFWQAGKTMNAGL